jgi:hypothetical protein
MSRRTSGPIVCLRIFSASSTTAETSTAFGCKGCRRAKVSRSLISVAPRSAALRAACNRPAVCGALPARFRANSRLPMTAVSRLRPKLAFASAAASATLTRSEIAAPSRFPATPPQASRGRERAPLSDRMPGAGRRPLCANDHHRQPAGRSRNRRRIDRRARIADPAARCRGQDGAARPDRREFDARLLYLHQPAQDRRAGGHSNVARRSLVTRRPEARGPMRASILVDLPSGLHAHAGESEARIRSRQRGDQRISGKRKKPHVDRAGDRLRHGVKGDLIIDAANHLPARH